MTSLTYPHPILTKIHGLPTFNKLKILEDEICVNAGSIKSLEGGGAHGHIGMVINAVKYATISGTVWTDPIEPAAPTYYNNTDNQRACNKDRYQLELKEFQTFKKTQQEIRNQIIAAVDMDYMKTAKAPYTGLSSRSVLFLMEHLFNNYGKVPAAHGAKKLNVISEKLDPTKPLVEFWEKIYTTQQALTTVNAQLTEAQQLMMIRAALEETGIYRNDLIAWDAKPAIERATVLQMQEHFNLAYAKKLVENEILQNNFGIPLDAAQIELIEATTNQSILELANATATANESQEETIAKLQQQITDMQQMVNNTNTNQTNNRTNRNNNYNNNGGRNNYNNNYNNNNNNNGGRRNNNNNNATNYNNNNYHNNNNNYNPNNNYNNNNYNNNNYNAGYNNNDRSNYRRSYHNNNNNNNNNNNTNNNNNNNNNRSINDENVFYCHSHGFIIGRGTHTSSTCTQKHQGHDDSATKLNRKGGSIRGAGKINYNA